jgi:hypothetical protein
MSEFGWFVFRRSVRSVRFHVATAVAVSGDGTVVVGSRADGSAGFRWTEAGGVQVLPFQPTDA